MSEPTPCCPDWEPGIKKLDAPIVLQSIRASRDLYTGKPFNFCPWCGQARQQNQETPPEVRGQDTAVRGAVTVLRRALDGQDDGVGTLCHPELESFRRELIKYSQQISAILEISRRLAGDAAV